MIPVDLARRLRDAGLPWEPADGDQFLVPDRGMEEMVFTVSRMAADVHAVEGHQLIGFSGAAEWALDSILQHEVVWLPSEARLRTQLGAHFRSLERTADGHVCRIAAGDGTKVLLHPEAEGAYALALLDLLERGVVARAPRPAPALA